MVLEQDTEWTFDEGTPAWNVGTGDVDQDGVLEIITVGCTALGGLCDPDMRIWSIPNVSATPTYLPYALGAIALTGAAASCAVALSWQKKKKAMAK